MKIDEYGGGEKWMIQAARGLTGAGHHVFIGGKKGSKILKRARQNNVAGVEFDIRTDFSPLKTIKIATFLKKNEIDVLVCNFNKDVRVAGLAAKLVKTPVTLARHGIVLCKKKWKHKITLKNLTDGIITNTNSIKNIYSSYGWFNEKFVRVIYNGIEDKSEVIPHDYSDQFPHKKIIFSAGRLTKQKGFNYLIDAASLLIHKKDDFVFVIAGSGKQERALKLQIEKHNLQNSVKFLGHIDIIDPYLKGADLVVLSSIHEGMPNVLMEAMAVGKAVVATDVNGVRELVKEGETGEIVSPRNSAELASAINKLFNNPPLLKQYGIEGLKRVKKNFTLSKMINNLESYFLEKLSENKKNV
jgi:glycosyltransferase involved in cell wall biosynthesis